MQETDLQLIEQHVKQQNGKFKGLLVKERFAERFVSGDPGNRKVYEIRTKACNCLLAGDKIVLISMQHQGGRQIWSCLAVLEFHGNVKILNKSFEKQYPLHQVTQEEYHALQGNSDSEFCWAWHLELYKLLETRPQFHRCKQGCVIWVNFSLEELCATGEGEDQPSLYRSGTSLSAKRTWSSQDQEPPSSKRLRGSGSADLSVGRAISAEDLDASPADVSPVDDMEEEETEVSGFFDRESFPCMILLESEWRLLCQDQRFLLKPFPTQEEAVVGIVRFENVYRAVGLLHVDSCEKFEDAVINSSAKVKQDLARAAKRFKRPYLWNIKAVNVFDEQSQISFVSQKYKNRLFTMPKASLCHHALSPPANLNLKDTCSYFLNMCTPEQRRAISAQVQRLSDVSIRVGTTCSGSDIGITVLRQTISHLNAVEAWYWAVRMCSLTCPFRSAPIY